MTTANAEGQTQDLVERKRDGNVLILRINREHKRNAISRELADAIDSALHELDDDDSLWVGVLSGGDKFFSAGSDLRANGDYDTVDGGEYGIIRRNRKKPLIAAVEGFALGGGMEIVLACDLVVAASDSRFGLPEVGIGVLPTCGALFRAPQSLPVNIARQMILTGQPISAERGYQVGFVNVLSEPGAALADAVDLAKQVAKNAPLSVQASLAAVNNEVGRDSDEAWAQTEKAKETMMGTNDSTEGVLAFFERREPNWSAS